MTKLLFSDEKIPKSILCTAPQFIRLQMCIRHFISPSTFTVYASDYVMLSHPKANYDECNL